MPRILVSLLFVIALGKLVVVLPPEKTIANVKDLLARHRVDLSDQQVSLLVRHLQLVLAINEELNLTAIRDFDAGAVLHIEDSLVALKEIGEAPDGVLGDMGSGAGYPGLPLAVASGRDAVLIDSSQKKMCAVENMVNELRLSDSISVSDQRIEDLARVCPNSFSVLTARGLSSLPSLLELASPLLAPGGWLVALKAKPDGEELERGEKVAGLVGMVLCSKRETFLSSGDTRTILCYTKDGEPSVGLPRRTGLAQKRPLA